MSAATIPIARYQVPRYNDGRPFVPARGRYAPREGIVDRYTALHPVMDLAGEQPNAEQFLRLIVRELKIRFYR